MIIISQKAEHNFVRVMCGIMDQYSSMFGEKKSALLLDCRKINSISFKIDFSDYKLILVNTNVKHQLSESAYNNRRAVCENISKLLKIRALRDATENDLNKLIKKISDEDYKKALYVIQENNRVKETVKAINAKNLKKIGLLLYLSHEGLKNLYKVSCDELDFLVDQTIDNPYILGARMMGGGFGGCTINLIKKSEVKNFKKETLESYSKQFNINCSFYSVKLSKGTRLIK
jgi:galactokinase